MRTGSNYDEKGTKINRNRTNIKRKETRIMWKVRVAGCLGPSDKPNQKTQIQTISRNVTHPMQSNTNKQLLAKIMDTTKPQHCIDITAAAVFPTSVGPSDMSVRQTKSFRQTK